MNHTLFISDLHLQPERPDITEYFLDFLANRAPSADALYILGDLFEAWVGSDYHPEFTETITQAILRLTRTGVPVYFMRGNRDFLIGKDFAQATGCQLLTDPSVIQIYGTLLLLTHGDALCTQDKKHQIFRKITQNTRYPFAFLKLLFLKSPLFLRHHIARLLRGASRKHTGQLSYAAMDVTDSAIEALLKKYQVTRMIHGHTHRPNVHTLTIDGKKAERIVLGDWEKKASVLVYYSDGRFELDV